VSTDDTVALVALARRVGLDAPGLADRVERDGPGPALATALGTATTLLPDAPEPLLEAAREQLARWHGRGIRALSVLDDDYPENLRAVHDRPALLFLSGTLRDDDRRAIAVVGSRQAGAPQRRTAGALASELVAAGHTVVSGLAAGIDAAAHRAALRAGGRTIAVIGTGLQTAYPPEHAELQQTLAADHAVVSPFWPESPPSAEGFRRRNGVMSGISRGTLIVAATQHSGTRVQARLALAHGRPVFLLAPLLAQPWAVELAKRPNVHVVQSAAEVVAVTERLHDPGAPEAP
jgi:DNA processing protein